MLQCCNFAYYVNKLKHVYNILIIIIIITITLWVDHQWPPSGIGDNNAIVDTEVVRW